MRIVPSRIATGHQARSQLSEERFALLRAVTEAATQPSRRARRGAEQRPGAGDLSRGDAVGPEIGHPRIPARAPGTQGVKTLAPVHVGIGGHRVARPERPGRPRNGARERRGGAEDRRAEQRGHGRSGQPFPPRSLQGAQHRDQPAGRGGRPQGEHRQQVAHPDVLRHRQREGGGRTAGRPSASPARPARTRRQPQASAARPAAPAGPSAAT